MRLRGGDLPDRYREMIARHAAGRTFADVGCMWKVDGAYAFHALDAGATDVVGVDLMPPSAAFETANAQRGNRVRFVRDINARVAYRSRHRKLGLDTAFVPEDGYANWYWAFTPSCVEAMVCTAGFRISERFLYPHALCLVCHPSPRP